MKKILSAALVLGLAGCASALRHKEIRWLGVQRLEYIAQGAGSPTVVFNSNTDMDSWAKVLPQVASFTSVFADNRPGHGRSKPAMGQNTGRRVVARLHRLLAETGQHPPYVLVGHSYSGLFSNLYARTYPQEVAGVVFVDSSHPGQQDWWYRHRPLESMMYNEIAKKTYNFEYFSFDAVAADIAAAGPFPPVPVIVITAGKKWLLDTKAWREQWLRFQGDLAALSPCGKRITAEKSGHQIQLQQPEIVVGAIREIVDQVRNSGHADQ
ncbi:MAG: alpha/beta hydrolase [Candidatus Aminicenantes bacterium]|nr:alpha/beta hydrolase [Candidatus Aminicenantes bacterium]